MPSNPVKSEIQLPRGAFSKVRQAREALRERADELIDKYLQVVDFAIAKGDAESAYKALQWLLDHLPAEDDGSRVFDRSVDKVPPTSDSGSSAPAINIGIALGGIPERKPKALPKAEVIDMEKK